MAKGKDKPRKETKKPPKGKAPPNKKYAPGKAFEHEGPMLNPGERPRNYQRIVQV